MVKVTSKRVLGAVGLGVAGAGLVMAGGQGTAGAKAATQPDLSNTKPPTLISEDDTVTAEYEGRSINLRESWEDAQACVLVDPIEKTAKCFSSKEDLLKSGLVEVPEVTLRAASAPDAESARSLGGGGVAPQATGPISCTYNSDLWLFEHANHAGAVLVLPGSWSGQIELVSMGWNDRTSSWKNWDCYSAYAVKDVPTTYEGFWMYGGYEVDYVGDYWNDQVSGVRLS